MSTFKIGDTVKLKSGGPKMTVTHVLPGDQYGVCYFSDRTSMREQFPGDALGIQEAPRLTAGKDRWNEGSKVGFHKDRF